MEFEIIVDRTEKIYKKIYKSSIDYWIKHNKLLGKILLKILNIGCILLALIGLLLFILKPQNYIVPLICLGWALFWCFITPKVLRYIVYVKHKKELMCIVKMRFSQHEYIIYHPTYELKIPYNRIRKLVETDKFLMLYPIPSSDRKKHTKPLAM